MNKNKKLKIILILILIVGAIGAGYYFLSERKNKLENTMAENTFGWKYPVAKFPTTGQADQLAYSDIRDPGGIAEGLPVRLRIPSIGVSSAIEDALITPDGRMDVPAGSVNVAWFALGPHPGQTGSAVIGGHFGIRNGVKFVFYDLDKLEKGDKIYIEDDKSDTLTFIVRSIKLFDRNADATTVFTSDDGLAHLNLITCEGIWNRVNNTYPDRRVVFADLVSGEDETLLNIPSEESSMSFQFNRTLRVGSRGKDVMALQNLLTQKRFSPGVADGIFGTVTRTAVIKYQKSVGLLSDGVFGPFTKTKMLSDFAIDTRLPNAGTEKTTNIMNVNDSSYLPQNFTGFIKYLFANPLDGLVTLLLFVAIVFMTFKIIFRS